MVASNRNSVSEKQRQKFYKPHKLIAGVVLINFAIHSLFCLNKCIVNESGIKASFYYKNVEKYK